MNKKVFAYFKLMSLGVTVVAVLFPAKMSAVIINGSTVTLQASDRLANNTLLIQGYLNNATYTKIIIQPGAGGASWLTAPLTISHSNTEIHLDAGTIIETLTGAYDSDSACVITASGKSNVKITGDPNSKIFMHKSEYASKPNSEWRHILNLLSCNTITISGITLEKAGGDGIYLGDSSSNNGYCSDVTIANVIIDGAARNAISVISADGVSITGCTLKNTTTEGNLAIHGPWAGIDLEPNFSGQLLKNITIDNCKFYNNLGAAICVEASKLYGSTQTISITGKNCIMAGNNYGGVEIKNIPASLNDNSLINFTNCWISDSTYAGIRINNKDRDSGYLSFKDCYLKNNALWSGGDNSSVYVYSSSGDSTINGNIQFDNIVIQQPTHYSISYYMRFVGTYGGIDNIIGTVYKSSGTLYQTGTSNINVNTSTNSPNAIWKMDETTGTTALDDIGILDGTLYNNPPWISGMVGGGVGVNGTNQLVSIPDNALLDIGTGNFSIALWMQRSADPVTNKRLIYKGASSDSDIGYAISGSNTTLGMSISNGVSRIENWCAIPSLDTWHHIAFTVDRTNGKIKSYVNGVYYSETSISAFSGGNISNATNLLIGAVNTSGGLAWPGKVDEVRVYGRALTSEEVSDFSLKPSAMWSFNEGSGSVASDSCGRSNGALTNSPAWCAGIQGQALQFNGTNQFVNISSNSNDLNIGTGNFSIALWMQRSADPVTNKRLIYKGASSDSDIGYAISGSNTTLGMSISNGVSRIENWCAIPSLDTWHHIAFTVDRTNGKIKSYVNGVYYSETSISAFSGGNISNATNLLIGAVNTSGGLAWPGKIDELHIFKSAISADIVMRLYSASRK